MKDDMVIEGLGECRGFCIGNRGTDDIFGEVVDKIDDVAISTGCYG